MVPLLVVAGVWASRPPPPPLPEAVFDVELVRLQAPPRPPSEQPPGPRQVEAQASRPVPAPVQPRPQPIVPAMVDPIPQAPPRVGPAVEARAAPETTAPPSRPAPPAASAAAAAQTWEGRLLAHLERRKRYPAEARSRRLQGVAYVRFTMDRRGRVLSAALERSSGHVVLDREAVALLRRSQPLPEPPADLAGETLSLSVPIEFYVR